MPLSSDDIQQPRRPSELAEFVERVRACVRSDPVELGAGNTRRGYYKEFLDEVVPLSHFAAKTYDDCHTVQPILGNQGYDAVVRDASGRIVDKVEIANPIDGANVAAVAHEKAERGYGSLKVGDPGDDVEDLIAIIEWVAKKKAAKDYSDVTVVFNVAALPPFKGFEARHEEQMDRARDALAKVGFKAKRVFMLHPPEQVNRIDA